MIWIYETDNAPNYLGKRSGGFVLGVDRLGA